MSEISSQFSGTRQYNLEAILTELKGYTHTIDAAIPEDIVFKSLLLSIPKCSDYLAILCLLPSSSLQGEPITKVISMISSLHQCDFVNVWALLDELKIASSFPNGRSVIQKFILSILSITFQQAPLSTILKLTNTVIHLYSNLLCVCVDFYVLFFVWQLTVLFFMLPSTLHNILTYILISTNIEKCNRIVPFAADNRRMYLWRHCYV